MLRSCQLTDFMEKDLEAKFLLVAVPAGLEQFFKKRFILRSFCGAAADERSFLCLAADRSLQLKTGVSVAITAGVKGF